MIKSIRSALFSRIISFVTLNMIGVFLVLIPTQAHASITKDRLSDTPVVASSDHSFALEDGVIWGWGFDNDSRLGTGNPPVYTRLIPEPVADIDEVISVAAAYTHTLALNKDGTVWAWGDNSYGQLGTGDTEDCNTPVQVPDLSGIIDIDAGLLFSLAVDDTGAVWSWGRNTFSQLGDGTTIQRTSPIKVAGLVDVEQVAAGWGHSLALDKTGTVYAWGHNGYGQTGIGTIGYDPNTPEPVLVLTDVVQIEGGRHHSMALDSDGHVWTWGRDLFGQLGEGQTWRNEYSPVHVTTLNNISSISAGDYHNLAVDSDGKVWAWGHNNAGQLGNNNTEDQFTPIHVSSVQDAIAYVAAGYEHSMAVDVHGQIFGWGVNFEGRLGNGERSWNYDPVGPVKALFHHKYRILVIMLSREDVGQDISAIEADMLRMVEDLDRYSYGKLAVDLEFVGPYLAEPSEIGCSGSNGDGSAIRHYAVNEAYARGIAIDEYHHVIIELQGNLRPDCRTSNNGGISTITYDGGVLNDTGITTLLPGGFHHTEYNRHVVAHEFLHGYANSTSHSELVSCDSCAAYVPDEYDAIRNPFCSKGTFHSSMNIMSLPGLGPNDDNHPNVNGIHKNYFRWLPQANIITAATPGIYDLYPVDDDTLASDKIYLIKLPARGPSPEYFEQEYALEYRKKAEIGRIPALWTWPGVYLYMREKSMFTDHPSAYILKTQPDDPNTADGITPLSTESATVTYNAGYVVEIVQINDNFARLKITSLAADLSYDCNVNLTDLAILASRWQDINCGNCDWIDITGDGNIDVLDLYVLAQQWLIDRRMY